MRELTVREITKAVSGRLVSGNEDAVARGVSKDSRAVAADDVWFALVGERYDGNAFAFDAAASGCRIVVVSDEKTAYELRDAHDGLSIILVKNSIISLQDLAAHYIRGFDMRRMAVTGSTGKTTTKDMLFHICAGRYAAVKSEANMNNEVGLPLSVLSAEPGTRLGVFEMGMYRAGEIERLADIVRPQVGVITNVGTSHIRNFENREGIRDAKFEITRFMTSEDSLVVNTMNEMLADVPATEAYRLIKVGNTGRNDFILSGVESEGEKGISFFLEHGDEAARFFMPILGAHNAANAALAVAAASRVGIGLSEAAERLADFNVSGRLVGRNGMKIIDDSYNASPDSMRAALDMLETVKGIRKIAILGDMNELGDDSRTYHREVGAYAAAKKPGLLVTVGEKAADIAAGARTAGAAFDILRFDTKDAAWVKLKGILTAGDVILVKGSRGMAMEDIVKRILE